MTVPSGHLINLQRRAFFEPFLTDAALCMNGSFLHKPTAKLKNQSGKTFLT